jgi:hypothetical protein
MADHWTRGNFWCCYLIDGGAFFVYKKGVRG